MSFFRTLLVSVAVLAIASPVLAEENATQTAPTQQTATSDASAKINLNKASAKELMKVKGINAARAKAIIAYRKKHGEFKSTDDLANVKGFKKISSNALKNIETQVSVD